ncbi:MAG: hypothetical protein ACRD2X_11200 [Vicinamibacteraceae bacterium]
MSRRGGKRVTGSLPPLLIRLIRAANRQRPDAAQALTAYGRYALVAIPTQGVLPADQYDLFKTVEQVARKHLGSTEARREFRQATESIEPLERRDAIQSAATHVQVVSDEAYFLAGLAFGITFAQLDRH